MFDVFPEVLNDGRESSDGLANYIEEARLIIECKLTQITTANIDDFYSMEAKEYLTEAYTSPGEIRQYVFGEISCVWLRK